MPLVKGVYNDRHGVEMTVNEGVYTINVYKYPEFTYQKDSLVTLKCSNYDQASLTFANINENLENIKIGAKKNDNFSNLYFSIMQCHSTLFAHD